ncbi:hypothetical protein V6N11_001031 [Hibiscus sabdariffa]|uniref:Uncharacterized protein n=1 Tax=Hibiscus sabdariffa TaxID=183260 RepID=A0ABR2RYJ6_9ROSI
MCSETHRSFGGLFDHEHVELGVNVVGPGSHETLEQRRPKEVSLEFPLELVASRQVTFPEIVVEGFVVDEQDLVVAQPVDCMDVKCPEQLVRSVLKRLKLKDLPPLIALRKQGTNTCLRRKSSLFDLFLSETVKCFVNAKQLFRPWLFIGSNFIR